MITLNAEICPFVISNLNDAILYNLLFTVVFVIGNKFEKFMFCISIINGSVIYDRLT